ncbi:PDR/VanB family oxidoreductase [Nocardiopsis aegyptia]|uniref:Phthalate 4,5-dioxygenase reductase subunit n=1 Tax=Nocardiopsis aegyptia TaxID=220378 RepID=A0A7Z0JC42_9ACTN|nr:PDR/VanB family oxidoreductase [Nocardiopsis aegyptia]NYJ36963.1 phthalate 4,5-dioxygenase reductase subunit [Nocardiopsis aegyptia]
MSRTDLSVRVSAKEMLTPSICRFELRAADGGTLPPFTPGAHVNVRGPGGAVRSYSLTDGDERMYAISVAREAAGRGGSVALVDGTAPGDTLTVSEPRNDFELLTAKRHLLIAGGIGITPMRAMFHRLRAEGGSVRLLYLTRTAEETAYLDELRDPELADQVVLHHSSEAGRLDLWPYLAEPDDGARVYCCGSRPLMEEVRALTMHWRPSRIHFEDFSGVDATANARPFRATWAPTGRTVEVGTGRTLLDALRGAGADVPSSCRSGTCGTCRLRLVSGAVEHRDLYLSEDERASFLMPCVSRAEADTITVGPVED